MKTKFEIRDKVFDIRFGWGKIIKVYYPDWEEKEDNTLVFEVELENGDIIYYTKRIALKLLSFTEYTLKGLNQIHKRDYSQYIGKWCKFRDKNFEKFYYLCVLKEVDEKGYFHDSEDDVWDICEPLTDEQIKILNLG